MFPLTIIKHSLYDLHIDEDRTLRRLQKALKTLNSAESSVRSLVADAANAGDYDEALNLTNLAKSIANLTESLPASDKSQALPTRAPVSKQPSKNGTSKTRVTKKAKGKSYPRFIQSNGDLVKIGWSKSASKEYQHKAPRQVLRAVADALKAQRMDDGVLRPPHEFLPLSHAGGEQIPDYQSYLCIAWLRDIGIVERHGRHGYSVPDLSNLEGRIADAWTQLSKA